MSKATISAMAESTVQSVTNSELLELNRRRKAKANQVQGNYGAARVMNQDINNERKENILLLVRRRSRKEGKGVESGAKKAEDYT